MIRSHRVLDAPELAARHAVSAWLERRARLHATTTTGIVCDDRLFQRAFERSDVTQRAVVTVVLDGRALVAVPDGVVELRGGDGVVLPSKEGCLMRLDGEPYASLVVEWELAPGAARPALQRFRARDVDVLHALADRVHRAELPEPETVAAIITALRAAGPALSGLAPDATTELAPKESRFQELADAIDAALTDLRGQPMTRDLETRLGLSSRQLTRLVEAFNERYGLGATNWLDTRNRRRLLLAATFLTSPAATVAGVAELVGYRRPETMARAFANAGYPPPSRVRGLVRELGDAWEKAVRAGTPAT